MRLGRLKTFPFVCGTMSHLSIPVQRYISKHSSIKRIDSASASAPMNTSTGSPSPKTAPDETTPAAMPWTWYAPALVSIIQQAMKLLRRGFTFPDSHVRFPACFRFRVSRIRVPILRNPPNCASLTTAEGYLEPETSPKCLRVERRFA
jgi:hypothetical protein